MNGEGIITGVPVGALYACSIDATALKSIILGAPVLAQHCVIIHPQIREKRQGEEKGGREKGKNCPTLQSVYGHSRKGFADIN